MLACIGTSIAAADDHQFPDNPGFTTLAITTLAIEGLTGDEYGLNAGSRAVLLCGRWILLLSLD
jgi:hypothetical protein